MRGEAGRAKKPPRGATGRAAQGAGRPADPRRAAFFSHTLEGLGTPAAHCGAGAQARRRRGPHGDAPSRPRGPPASHAIAGPLAGRSTGQGSQRTAPTGAGAVRRNSPRRDGTGDDTHPSFQRCTSQRERMSEANSRPRYRGAQRRGVMARRWAVAWFRGGAGDYPRERAGPSRPVGASEGARAILFCGPSWWGPPLLDTGTLFSHDPVTDICPD